MGENLICKPESFWVDVLRASVLAKDMDSETTRALVHHLSDLGVFRPVENDSLELVQHQVSEPTSQEMARILKERLSTLAATPHGFAVGFFLPDYRPGEHPLPEFLTEESPPAKSDTVTGQGVRAKLSSDPSNLQIVRKVERQLKNFIALEAAFTRHLCGPHTSKMEARKLFNYALGKIQTKTEPRRWEQLSRRRHK